jgi:hypothetical protein
MSSMKTNNTLAATFLDGLAGELSYMTTDEQAEALDRQDYLQCCDEDEIADAAAFLALAVRLGN